MTHAFSTVVLRETVEQIGKGKALAVKYDTRPATPPQILGIDANNKPYAWSLATWK